MIIHTVELQQEYTLLMTGISIEENALRFVHGDSITIMVLDFPTGMVESVGVMLILGMMQQEILESRLTILRLLAQSHTGKELQVLPAT